MFTVNYYKLLRQAAYGRGFSGIYAIDYNGNSRQLFGNQNSQQYLFPQTSSYTYMQGSISSSVNSSAPVMFGSGTTPPTVNDYKIEKLISTGLTINNTESVRSVTDEGVIFTNIYTLTNTSSIDITISEVAWYAYSYYSASASNNTHFLLDRTLLDSPVTIPAGEMAQVTYTLNWKLPAIPTA